MANSIHRILLLILGCAIIAHAILLVDLPLVLQALAVLLLTGLLPGLLVVELLIGQSLAPPSSGERLLYAVGAGYAVIVFVMLGVSYLPGGIARWQTLLVFDLLLIILVFFVWLRSPKPQLALTHPTASHALRTTHPSNHQSWVIVGLLLLLLIGGFLRLTNLGYAEFLTDEARTVLRAAAVIQGNEDVLFIHRKGPVEILLPAVIFALTGHLNEASARLPFALANLAAVGAVFLLGARMVGAPAGWITALLLALDGYLIGFARFVQYQSIVWLTSVLVVLIVYRLMRQPKAITHYLTLAALLLATGLLAHYDALIVAVPVLCLLAGLFWQTRLRWRMVTRAVLIAALVGGALLAIFYVPFFLHPHFRATYAYLVDQRISGGEIPFPFNNLVDFWRRSLVYNSTYAVVLLVVLALAALSMAYQRGWRRTWARWVALVMTGLLLFAFWQPTAAKIGNTDFTVLLFALPLLLVWLAPRLSLEMRTLWLWFGVPLLLTFFFMAQPGTHVYVFFTPWAMLIGSAAMQVWQWLRQRLGQSVALVSGGLALATVAIVFGLHAYWHFVDNQTEVVHTWPDNRPAGFWTPANFDATQIDRLYGFPLANGWKAVGMLYAQGVLQGDYETNQRDTLISDWYLRGQQRCASTATWYFVIDNLEPWSRNSAQVIEILPGEGFAPWGGVEVNGVARLAIYHRPANGDAPAAAMQTFQLNEYAAAFDASAQADLPLDYPAIESAIGHPLHINFADQIWLEGYDLTYNAPLQPGESLRLKLYWRAQQTMPQSYKVFNQAYAADGPMVAQKDAYPVCDRLPTSLWYPGELITDIHDITVNADAADGVYPLYTGLYLEETGDRLPVLDAAGNPVDQQVHVADIRIGE